MVGHCCKYGTGTLLIMGSNLISFLGLPPVWLVVWWLMWLVVWLAVKQSVSVSEAVVVGAAACVRLACGCACPAHWPPPSLCLLPAQEITGSCSCRQPTCHPHPLNCQLPLVGARPPRSWCNHEKGRGRGGRHPLTATGSWKEECFTLGVKIQAECLMIFLTCIFLFQK